LGKGEGVMKGVILAGGRGTRLLPLTHDIPKPMLPLLGKPVMEYSIELLKKYDITTIAVMIHHHGEKIRSYFGDGSKWGVELTYFEDSPPLGTAGSIKAAEHFLDEPFVVISGDTLTNIRLLNGIQFHQQSNALLTIFMKKEMNPTDFGVITTNQNGEIIHYIEKPLRQEIISYMVNTGVYIVEPTVLQEIKPNCFMDFSHHIIPILLERKRRVYGYVTMDYWIDIGTFRRYKRAKRDLVSKKMKLLVPKRKKDASIALENQIK
jgi:mannose-1-phosphate guanylyltransferase / phosphomannomutase